MAQSMQYEFRLFGNNAGKTMVVNGHKFVGGKYQAIVASVAAAPLMKVLSYYGAYAKGTPEYDAALKKEEGNGAVHVPEATGGGASKEVRRDVQPDGRGSAEASSDDGDGAVEDTATRAGSDPTGDGHGHAGIVKFEEASSIPSPTEPTSVGSDKVKQAILKLDPDVDDHWVQTGAHKGKPKLSAVEVAYGQAGLTRQDLEAAIPGWTREKAINRALDA